MILVQIWVYLIQFSFKAIILNTRILISAKSTIHKNSTISVLQYKSRLLRHHSKQDAQVGATIRKCRMRCKYVEYTIYPIEQEAEDTVCPGVLSAGRAPQSNMLSIDLLR